MAAKRFNDGKLHKTHELALTRDERGFWSGTQVYYCAKDKLAVLAPLNGSAHEDYPWLVLESLSVTGEEAGWMRLEGNYTGVLELGGGGEENEPTYALDLSLSEEPLETHPRYVNAIEEGDITEDDLQEAVTLARNPPLDALGKPKKVNTSDWEDIKVELYDFIRSGFESYRDPKVTWTKSWVSDEQPDNLNEIGEIFTPSGSPPDAADGRNWLFVGLRSRQRGQVFENEEVAELSGRGGWNDVIYTV